MRIVDVCRISGRGHAIFTDEIFSSAGLARARTKKTIRVSSAGRSVEFDIIDVEAILKTGGVEFLGFLVPFIEDEAIRTFIVNRDLELI